MMPVEVWRSLLGALVMIGATICAAVCIMSAVKAGSTALTENLNLVSALRSPWGRASNLQADSGLTTNHVRGTKIG